MRTLDRVLFIILIAWLILLGSFLIVDSVTDPERDPDTLWTNSPAWGDFDVWIGEHPVLSKPGLDTIAERKRVYGRAMRRLKEKGEDYK